MGHQYVISATTGYAKGMGIEIQYPWQTWQFVTSKLCLTTKKMIQLNYSTNQSAVLPIYILQLPVPVLDPATRKAERASCDETAAVEASPS